MNHVFVSGVGRYCVCGLTRAGCWVRAINSRRRVLNAPHDVASSRTGRGEMNMGMERAVHFNRVWNWTVQYTSCSVVALNAYPTIPCDVSPESRRHRVTVGGADCDTLVLRIETRKSS